MSRTDYKIMNICRQYREFMRQCLEFMKKLHSYSKKSKNSCLSNLTTDLRLLPAIHYMDGVFPVCPGQVQAGQLPGLVEAVGCRPSEPGLPP